MISVASFSRLCNCSSRNASRGDVDRVKRARLYRGGSQSHWPRKTVCPAAPSSLGRDHSRQPISTKSICCDMQMICAFKTRCKQGLAMKWALFAQNLNQVWSTMGGLAPPRFAHPPRIFLKRRMRKIRLYSSLPQISSGGERSEGARAPPLGPWSHLTT